MNTGGFFVAKFVKESTQVDSKPNAGPSELNKEYHPITADLYENLVSFYGIDKEIFEQLLCREGHDRHIYYLTPGASRMLRECTSSAMKLVSIGVRVFAEIGKWESPCPYRMTQEGVQAFRSIQTARIGRVDLETMIELIETREIKTHRIPDFSGIAKGGAVVVCDDGFGGDIRMAVMVSPVVTQAYAEKLYCGWLSTILRDVYDPTTVVSEATKTEDEADIIDGSAQIAE
jgi:hypothetical protein